jgi:hypothetical protein
MRVAQEAADPNTPPARLAELAAKGRRRATRAAVARNPSTPLDIILRLLEVAPGDVLENPAFPLLLLERPGLFQELSTAAYRALLALPEPPTAAFLAAGRRVDLVTQEAVFQHPRLPAEAVAELARDPQDQVRSAAAASALIPVPLLEELSRDPAWEVRSAVALNPRTPLPVIERLAKERGFFEDFVHFAADRALGERLAREAGPPAPCRPDISRAVDAMLFAHPRNRRRVAARKARLIAAQTGEDLRTITQTLLSFLPEVAQ